MDTTQKQKTDPAPEGAGAAPSAGGDVLADPLAALQLADPLAAGREDGAELPVEPASDALEEDVVLFERALAEVEAKLWEVYYGCEIYNTAEMIQSGHGQIGAAVRKGQYDTLIRISVLRTTLMTSPGATLDDLIKRSGSASLMLRQLTEEMGFLMMGFGEEHAVISKILIDASLEIDEHTQFLGDFQSDLSKGFVLPE